MAGMTQIKCIHSGGYDGVRKDVGGRWKPGEVRTISDTAASYLLNTFPAWFVVNAPRELSKSGKSMNQPPADRAMQSPSAARSLPDLTQWLAMSNRALSRRVNAGKVDDILAHLAEAMDGNEDRASVLKAIKARTAKIAG